MKYNAIKKFKNNIIKIPSYVVDDVFEKKKTIDIYHNGKYQISYNWDSLVNYIKNIEDKEYDGKFRNKDIKYKLNHVEIS